MCWDLPAVAAARTTCRDQHDRATWLPVLEAWVPVLYASGEAVCIVGSSIYMTATFAGGCPEACGLVGKQVVETECKCFSAGLLSRAAGIAMHDVQQATFLL